MINFVKKYKLIIILIVVGLIIVVIIIPALLNILFKISAPFEIFEAEWEASAALSYYGEILAFLSTMALSILALWQNIKTSEANDRHTVLLEQMEREKNAPRFIFEECVVLGRASNLTFEIINVTDNIAQGISLSDFSLINEAGQAYWNNKHLVQISYLGPLMKHKIELRTDGIKDSKDQLVFSISYSDIFNTKYKKKVVGYFSDNATSLRLFYS